MEMCHNIHFISEIVCSDVCLIRYHRDMLCGKLMFEGYKHVWHITVYFAATFA